MVTQRRIRVMSQDLALKIAAGEVVERPASVVKELLDNAIDAGARSIKVDVREAGLKLIRVTDDGLGITRDDIPLAFTSHATSKIDDLDDLQNLTTLGFRGEALASIAAVARVEVQTRASGEQEGARFVIEDGQVRGDEPWGAAQGLRISVNDLFANVPARRAFVRSLRAEGAQIQNVVMQYALAQPAVQFSLTIDDRLTFHTAGTGRLADAVSAVHGPDVLPMMQPVNLDEVRVRVAGLISIPKLNRQNRSAISIFVNGRPVQNRSLVFALEEAYSGLLMTGRHPVAAVHLSVSPSDVDVNIHPAKREVRFAADREVHGVLHRAVQNSLLDLRVEWRETTAQEASPGTWSAAPSPLPSMAGVPDAEGAAPSLLPGLPALRVFGQANQTFIVAEGPEGVYMIDQHAAHERVLFDQLDEMTGNGLVDSQQLLEPHLTELTSEQMTVLEENRELLQSVGFVVEPFGHKACLIRSIPLPAKAGKPEELVSEVLNELQALPEPAGARERALAALACKAAVKAGETLDLQEMRELVARLEQTPRPSTCPHGRPTMIHLSHSRLEREFGRR